jgi:hypothetical protein
MIDLKQLKEKLLEQYEGDAIVYLSQGIGDKLMYLSQLNNYRQLMNCNITLISRAGKSADLVNFFPSLRGRHVPLDEYFYQGYTELEVIRVLNDQRPGMNRIFNTWYLGHADVELIQAWLQINSKAYNQFNLAKHQLNLPTGMAPELIEADTNLTLSLKCINSQYVVLAPLANSAKNIIDREFWCDLAKELIAQGYKCFVNSFPVPNNSFAWDAFENIGCELFSGDFNSLIHLCQGAKHTYTIRSGFADLLSLTQCMQYSVFYPPEFMHLNQFLTLDHGFGSTPATEEFFYHSVVENPAHVIAEILNKTL